MHVDQILKVVVVEDNPDAMANLLECLAANPSVRVAGTADNGEEGIALINETAPDLLFLDVEMPVKNGFEVLEAIRCSPGVVFVTAYDRFAVKAFEVNGIDYIVKPVSQARVDTAVNRARDAMAVTRADLMAALAGLAPKKSFRKRFTVKTGDQIYIIPREEVFGFKAEDKYVFLCTRDREYFYSATLKQLMEELDPEAFCRVNKSSIVAIDKIRKLKKNYRLQTCLVLDDDKGTTIRVSRNRLAELKARLDA